MGYFDISDRVIVVTGGGRGLGRAISMGLATSGARVMVAGRTGSDVEAVAATLRNQGFVAEAFAFEATDAGQCAALVEATIDRFGRIDGMVVNHGVSLHASAFDTTPDEFRRVVDVNLTSLFLAAQAAGRAMRKQEGGGSIVLMSSNASFLAYDELAAYGASKGGVDQLCRQLGAEWAADGIRVNAIGPGYMNSHMRGVDTLYEDPDFRKAVDAKIPMARWGEADELVGTVIYFLSGASSYVTGQYVAVDGGYSLW